MATLFFEGFDRATVLRKLDSNYWSTQYKNYPRYAFGGYTYANEEFNNYRIVYTYSNVNNGIEPRLVFNGYTGVNGYIGISFNERYPALGQMPGFLALTNIPINDQYNLEPITYLQISGFPNISGSKSYFGMRCLGIETKHQDYWDEDHPLGRFGSKHPLLAFCSGNTTGLILNIVAISGNHLLPLRTNDPPQNEGRRISMGLEVEQHGASSGVFDLNIGDTISDYRITPIYCAGSPYEYATPYYIPTNSDYKLLTIATSPRGGSVRSVNSRWTHFEFEIDHDNGVIKAKIEGVDALVENTDIDTNREDWDISIHISGFKYDNIRLFNRTYMSGIVCNGWAGYFPSDRPWSDINTLNTSYYYHGALTLYDDITLIDSTGVAPNYYVGYDSKVLPIHPGHIGPNNILDTDSNQLDGLLQWNTSASSHRRALTSLDKDVSTISTSTSGAVNAIVYSNINLSVDNDPNSLWRTTFNDGIGGIKVYNSARKNFLDASYVNVVREPNPDAGYSPEIYLQAENNIIKNYIKSQKNANKFGNTTVSNTIRLTNQSIDFTTSDSFIYVETPNIGSSSFTIESWVYLPTTGAMMLFDTVPINNIRGDYRANQWYNYGGYPSNADNFYSLSVHTSGIDLNMGGPNRFINRTLLFSTPLVTGTWNHVAITRNSDKNIICYLNGISGTTYVVKQNYDDGYWIHYPYFNEFREPTGIYNKALKIPASSSPYNDLVVTFSNLLIYNVAGYPAIYPTWYTNIGRNGYIDQYRFVLGTSLYNSDFTPDSTTRIKRPDDYYVEFGPVHESTRSLYIVDQFYQMTNPATNQPWSSGDVVTSGLILGVKKL